MLSAINDTKYGVGQKMKFRSALLYSALLFAPVAVNAQPINGIYVGGAGGIDWHGNNQGLGATTPSLGISISSSSTNTFKVGGIGAASVGYGFGNGLRTELEFA